jgi:hypothetical protein
MFPTDYSCRERICHYVPNSSVPNHSTIAPLHCTYLFYCAWVASPISNQPCSVPQIIPGPLPTPCRYGMKERIGCSVYLQLSVWKHRCTVSLALVANVAQFLTYLGYLHNFEPIKRSIGVHTVDVCFQPCSRWQYSRHTA